MPRSVGIEYPFATDCVVLVAHIGMTAGNYIRVARLHKVVAVDKVARRSLAHSTALHP